MTTLAAVIATIATAGLATDVTSNQGSDTQQEIVHIFDAANDLRNHNDDYLPTMVDAVYQLWPTVIPGTVTTTDVQHVTSVGVSGGNFLADTRGVLQVTETGEDVTWRSFQANRDMTIEAINEALFGDYRGLDVIDTNGFTSIHFVTTGAAAPSEVDDNEGIVGDAVDWVINQANLANWNAVRANGASAAGLALANAQIISDIIDERTAINDVLNEYDEAAARIMDGLL